MCVSVCVCMYIQCTQFEYVNAAYGTVGAVKVCMTSCENCVCTCVCMCVCVYTYIMCTV
jgi:hypothetical protein